MAGLIGAITGLIGSIASNTFQIFRMREQFKIEQLKSRERALDRKHEVAMINVQSALKIQETESELAIGQMQGSYEGLKSSLQSQAMATAGAGIWVGAVVAMVRPTITGLLILTVITLALGGKTELAIVSLIELTTAVVLWWFGDRSAKRLARIG